MKAIVFAALTFFLLPTNVFASPVPNQQASNTTSAGPASPIIVAKSTPISARVAPTQETSDRRFLEFQVANLKEQKEIIESYHDSILDTIFFAIGAVFTLTILLLGYSWWFNTRTYEKEKVALKEELALLIKSAEDRITVNEQSRRVEQDQQAANRIDALTDLTAKNYAQIRAEMTDQNRANTNELALNKLQTHWLQREFRMIEELVWEGRGIRSNSLFSIAQALSLSSNDQDDDLFNSIFDRFSKRAGEMIGNKDEIADATRDQITKRVEDCREKRPAKADEALALLAQVASKSSN